MLMRLSLGAQWHFWASWFCLVTGIMVTVLGAIGGLRYAPTNTKFTLYITNKDLYFKPAIRTRCQTAMHTL